MQEAPRSGDSTVVFDCHVHVGPQFRTSDDSFWNAAARAGIDRVIVSSVGREWSHNPPPEEVAEANRDTLDFVSRHRGFAWGLAYANPLHSEKGLDALRTALDAPGFVGIKLWVACPASDPHVFPIIEEAIRRGFVILQHSWLRCDGPLGGTESEPADIAELARRYPEVKIITPHLAGNKPWGLYCLKDCPNVYIDTSGSDPEAGVINQVCRCFGYRRLLYGSDGPGRSFASQIAKVTGSGISAAAARAIMGGNLQRMLKGLM